MPQRDAFGRVTQSGTDQQNNQAVDFMLRQALANQTAQVQREAVQSGERTANRGYDVQLATQGAYKDRAAQESLIQQGKYAGDADIERIRGANAVNLQGSANSGQVANTTQLGTNAIGLAHENNLPLMGEIDLKNRMYGDTSPAVKAKAEGEAARARFTSRLMEELLGGAGGAPPTAGAPASVPGSWTAPSPAAGGQPAPGGAPAPFGGSALTGSNRMKVLGSLLNVPGLGEDPTEAAYNEAISAKLKASMDPTGDYQAFKQTGRIPSHTSPEDIMKGLDPDVGEFVQGDQDLHGAAGTAADVASTLMTGGPGWVGSLIRAGGRPEPTSQDTVRIKAAYNRLVVAYKTQLGGDEAQARQLARADILKKLTEKGGGTGGITQDRQRELAALLR